MSNADGSTSEGEVIALREEIIELESSLTSSELENRELTERISILEGQLADLNRLVSLNVEDADSRLNSSKAKAMTAGTVWITRVLVVTVAAPNTPAMVTKSRKQLATLICHFCSLINSDQPNPSAKKAL